MPDTLSDPFFAHAASWLKPRAKPSKPEQVTPKPKASPPSKCSFASPNAVIDQQALEESLRRDGLADARCSFATHGNRVAFVA